ncbi:HTH-type transcriptional regulator KipR [bacterium YEK0313]|nr:HTH-type transcriptional regulator KipR [bacterium YEK0313]
MKTEPTAAVKSADRALDILEHVGDATEPPSFSRLMADLAIPRSSLFHLLNTLLARGYLDQDVGSGRYRLGPRVAMLAGRMAGPPLAVLVQPVLDDLSHQLNETSGFYVRAGDRAETIASAVGNQALSYTMKVGERAPLYAVSAGKVLLAALPPEEIAAYLESVGLDEITPTTIRSKDRLQEEIAAVRRDRFAYSREEFTPGITGIATAVLRHGVVCGALNLAVPTARFPQSREALFRRHLEASAAALGRRLEQSPPA